MDLVGINNKLGLMLILNHNQEEKLVKTHQVILHVLREDSRVYNRYFLGIFTILGGDGSDRKPINKLYLRIVYFEGESAYVGKFQNST